MPLLCPCSAENDRWRHCTADDILAEPVRLEAQCLHWTSADQSMSADGSEECGLENMAGQNIVALEGDRLVRTHALRLCT